MGASKENKNMSSRINVERYIGNSMNLDIPGDPKKSYLIIGNNCQIQLKNNLNSLEIIGNNCEVLVDSGNGTIMYIGNNGKIVLDPKIEDEVVTFLGRNGSVLTKNGLKQRNYSSESDVRICDNGCSINIEHVNGKWFPVKTEKKILKLKKLKPTISLPNIQINLSNSKQNNVR